MLSYIEFSMPLFQLPSLWMITKSKLTTFSWAILHGRPVKKCFYIIFLIFWVDLFPTPTIGPFNLSSSESSTYMILFFYFFSSITILAFPSSSIIYISLLFSFVPSNIFRFVCSCFTVDESFCLNLRSFSFWVSCLDSMG